MGRRMIFAKHRDPRLVTVRRGGTLQDSDHHRLAVWAADCAEHVLHYFEHARPGDDRPRRATELARAWARGEITMTQARGAAFANAAAREVSAAAKPEEPHGEVMIERRLSAEHRPHRLDHLTPPASYPPSQGEFAHRFVVVDPHLLERIGGAGALGTARLEGLHGCPLVVTEVDRRS